MIDLTTKKDKAVGYILLAEYHNLIIVAKGGNEKFKKLTNAFPKIKFHLALVPKEIQEEVIKNKIAYLDFNRQLTLL